MVNAKTKEVLVRRAGRAGEKLSASLPCLLPVIDVRKSYNTVVEFISVCPFIVCFFSSVIEGHHFVHMHCSIGLNNCKY